MPSKHVIRNFSENSYYHVFNRGVEKRKIFLDEQDYNMFLYYLSIYLLPLEQVLLLYPDFPLRLYGKNLNKEIMLISYCLMPNHFHLLLKQNSLDGVSKLLKQVTNAYTFYFNNKYKRVGGLMQGRFKAVSIETDELLLHIIRYIHLNPVVAGLVKNPKDYKWSSHNHYLGNGEITKSFVDTCRTLSYFTSVKKFESFILDHADYARELDKMKHIVLED